MSRKKLNETANNERKQNHTRRLKNISIATKMEVLKKIKSGKKLVEIERSFNLHEASVRTIKRNQEKIKRSANGVCSLTATKISRCRDPLIHKTETLLHMWIPDQRKKGSSISSIVIQHKARSLFEQLKDAEQTESVADVKFSASKGWLESFKKRFNIRNVHLTGEAASADIVAALAFRAGFQKIGNDNNYSPRQIFNVNETELFWKRMPNRSFITETEKSCSGFKAHKDRLTLLVVANVNGDVKLKLLLVFRSENPRALKNAIKSELPVIWKSNPKAWVTRKIFFELFHSYIRPKPR